MDETIHTRCCIAGGGPAGMMLGFLLARMGVDVVVLEKHADFLRDFRGDTIHPSTLEVMHELGILDEFLKRPHQEIRELSAKIGKQTIPIADLTHLPTRCQFVALMPQWDFLNFIKEQASRYPSFHLRMEAEATDLTVEERVRSKERGEEHVEEEEVITGVRAKTPTGALEIRAPLTVGADGRHSVVRERARLKVIDLGAPMDVFWMRLSRHPGDPGDVLGHLEAGRIFIMINRGTYWQCAYVIPKGEADKVRDRGLPVFRKQIAAIEPFLRDRVEELRDWNDVSLLTVVVDRLAQWWRPGLLCIGDAAHAMSPVGGVGINLAIQDAVATANILGPVLLHRDPTEKDLHAVQERRMFPTRATQRAQVIVQNNLIRRALQSTKPPAVPWIVKQLGRFPILRRIPARVIGLGFRPEHVKTPARPLLE